MHSAVGIRSLAVSFPSTIRTNDYWRRKYPDLVEDAEKLGLARLWKLRDKEPANIFEDEMFPYLSDAFRGTVQRRILGPGETALSLEVRAARDALAAARMEPDDVDLIMVSSFMPDQLAVGNSAFLSRELNYHGTAWNFESACNGGIVGLTTAAALVRSGQYQNVLVVVSCTYSRVSEDTDSVGWFLGDGAGAFVVSQMPDGAGIHGAKIVNSAATCGTFFCTIDGGGAASPRIRLRAHEKAGRAAGDYAEPSVRECTGGALEAAGMTIQDIDVLAGNTPMGWYRKFYARTLGIDANRIVDTYPLYANIGPALTPASLHHAASTGLLKPGHTVMLYGIGSVSSAGAIVMGWGDVGLGPAPAPPKTVE